MLTMGTPGVPPTPPGFPAGRRAEDRDYIQARSKAWAELQRLQDHLGLWEAFRAALEVYHRELMVAAVRRSGTRT